MIEPVQRTWCLPFQPPALEAIRLGTKERTRRRWQRLSDGQCPDETRVLVRGKDKYVAFGTRNPNGTWLSGRMMLDFDPVEWMLVPD